MENSIIRKREAIAAITTFTKVAAYARVSSSKEEMLHSLAAQVSYYSGYIRRHPGWSFAGVYADEGLTGTKCSRPEFARMVADCRAGRIDLVLTKSISRFARNTVDLLITVRELKELGVDVYFEEQNIHTLSGDGEFILTILASYAQEESLSVSENCKWRIRKRFENGELVNLRFMFGYRVTKGSIEIEPAQAHVVRMIYKDYVGGMSGGRIANKLRDLKVPTERGGTWDTERVLSLIRNEKFTGNALLQKKFVTDHLTKKVVKNKGALPMYHATGTHPAIIDQETFDEAQVILRESFKSCGNRSQGRNTYPFSSIICCSKCGKNYKRITVNGKAAWNCTTYLTEGKVVCKARMIPDETLTTVTADLLGLVAFDEGIFRERVLEIIAKDENHLNFIFRDGHTEETVWQQRSRRESWTDEMRQAAKERVFRRLNNGDKR